MAAEWKDCEEVQDLLEQLEAARDNGLYADFDLEGDLDDPDDAACIDGRPSDCTSTSAPSNTRKAPSDNDSSPAWCKRRRLAPADCTSFDFESDLLEECSVAALRSEFGHVHRGGVRQAEEAGEEPKTEYWYNPDTSRWEPRAPVKEAERKGGGNSAAQQGRAIAGCVVEARADASGGVCLYPQALAVRLALRFEGAPQDMLPSMAKAGLPVGTDTRTTVKALMKLCHPDKCQHPEAKRAMQVLGPLLTKR